MLQFFKKKTTFSSFCRTFNGFLLQCAYEVLVEQVETGGANMLHFSQFKQ